MLLFVAALVASTFLSASAAPSLIIEDPLQCTFPLVDNKCSFLLSSTEGDVAGVSVQVRQVKPPAGGPLSLDAVRAVLEATTVTPRGVHVSLILDPRYFVAPGEYRVSLFFQGGTGTPSLAGTVVINRPAADINIEELKDQTVSLTRWFPFLCASNDFLLHVRESSGKVSLNDFKVVGQGVYLKDSKELVPGEVTITPTPAPPAMSIAPGEVQTFKVTISKVAYTGAFDTRLLITSPSFNGSKTIPVKVNVHDFVLLPLIAIALGVLGAYYARKLVAVETPRNQNSLEILRLQNDIERFRELVKKPASMEIIQGLLTQLKRVSENNEAGYFATVKEELTKLRKEFDDFRKAQVEAESKAQDALSSLTRQIEDLLKDGSLTPTEASHLREIKEDKLPDIERLLRRGMVEDAELKIASVKYQLDDLRTQKLMSHFSDMKVELSNLSLSAEAHTQSELLKVAIESALDSHELDTAHAKLTLLKNLIEEQRRTRVRRGRETGSEAARLPEIPDVLARTTPVTHCKIELEPGDRIAGTTIPFIIIDVEKIIQQGDELRWYFGDLGSYEVGEMNSSHRYRESGRYQVRVEIVRGSGVVKTLTEMITILPGPIERARAAILQDIARNEKILSLIALVLAIMGGLAILYSGKLFGSLADYLMAILWGFGLDNSIKGFASVLSKISTPNP